MPKSHRPYPPEFRQRLIELVRKGRTPDLVGDLLNDPPGFDRAGLAEVDRKITAFFHEHLLPVPDA